MTGPLGGQVPGGESTIPTTVLLMLLQAVGGSLVITESDFREPPAFDVHAEWIHSPDRGGLRYEVELIKQHIPVPAEPTWDDIVGEKGPEMTNIPRGTMPPW